LVKDRPIDKITNKDRAPFYDEIVVCSPFLMEEMEILIPKLIVTLGKISGDWYSNYSDYKINTYYPKKYWLPLYHPSYLLRSKKEIDPFIEALSNVLKEKIYENINK
jgi:uracil-DNA glycosylase family 4